MNRFYVSKFRESDGQADVLALDTFAPQPLKVDVKRMSARGLLSALCRDRQGDVVRLDGMELGSHMRNPVVLIDHGKNWALPIGKCRSDSGLYTVEYDQFNEELWQTTFFSQSSPMAEQVFRLIEEDILRGNSPGFRPVECNELPDDVEAGYLSSRGPNGERRPAGKDVLRSELVEVSWCATPVNQEAAEAAVHKSFGGRPMIPALMESLRPWLPIPRAVVTSGWDGGAAKAWHYTEALAREEPGGILEALTDAWDYLMDVKAAKPIGHVSQRADGEYKKVGEGDWQKVTEGVGEAASASEGEAVGAEEGAETPGPRMLSDEEMEALSDEELETYLAELEGAEGGEAPEEEVAEEEAEEVAPEEVEGEAGAAELTSGTKEEEAVNAAQEEFSEAFAEDRRLYREAYPAWLDWLKEKENAPDTPQPEIVQAAVLAQKRKEQAEAALKEAEAAYDASDEQLDAEWEQGIEAYDADLTPRQEAYEADLDAWETARDKALTRYEKDHVKWQKAHDKAEKKFDADLAVWEKRAAAAQEKYNQAFQQFEEQSIEDTLGDDSLDEPNEDDFLQEAGPEPDPDEYFSDVGDEPQEEEYTAELGDAPEAPEDWLGDALRATDKLFNPSDARTGPAAADAMKLRYQLERAIAGAARQKGGFDTLSAADVEGLARQIVEEKQGAPQKASDAAAKAWSYLPGPTATEEAAWAATKAWEHVWSELELEEKARVVRHEGETWITQSGNKYTKTGGKIRKVYEGKGRKVARLADEGGEGSDTPPAEGEKPARVQRGGKGDPVKVRELLDAASRGEPVEGLAAALSALTVPQLNELIAEKEQRLGAEKAAKAEAMAQDYARLVKAEQEATSGKAPQKPEPGKVYNVSVDELQMDPSRFQYKISGVTGEGVTDEFKRVKTWNPDFAGVVSVWEDPETGKTYVVNGHHRRELAGRLGVKDMAVRYIQAKSAKEARAIGALINMAEGRGTALDAARFMRDAGVDVAALEERGISMKGKVAADAATLTRLSDKQFDRLARGLIDEQKALAVARHLDNPSLQDQLFNLLDKREEEGKDISPKVIEEMARKMAAAPTTKTSEPSLFGDIESEESLFVQQAEVQAFVRGELAREANDFAAVASKRRAEAVSGEGNVLDVEKNRVRAEEAEQSKNVYDTLVNTRGAIADAINAAAEEYAQAKTKRGRDDAKRKAADAVREAISREGRPGPAGEPAPQPGGTGERDSGGPGGTEGEPGASPGGADAGRGDIEPAGVEKPGFNPAHLPVLAAQGIGKARKEDVFRVMESAPPEHLQATADYIARERPDLKQEADEVREQLEREREEAPEEGPAPTTEVTPENVGQHEDKAQSLALGIGASVYAHKTGTPQDVEDVRRRMDDIDEMNRAIEKAGGQPVNFNRAKWEADLAGGQQGKGPKMGARIPGFQGEPGAGWALPRQAAAAPEEPADVEEYLTSEWEKIPKKERVKLDPDEWDAAKTKEFESRHGKPRQVDAARQRYERREETAKGGGLFGGEYLQGQEGIGKLPENAPILFTSGKHAGKTGKIVHEKDKEGKLHIVASIDGEEDQGNFPVLPDAIEPLNEQHSWRTGAAGSETKQGHLELAPNFAPRRPREEKPAEQPAPAAAEEVTPEAGPAPEDVVAETPTTKTTKDGTVWTRAKAGGEESPVNGRPYKGGQWMPIHGMSAPKEKKPPSGKPGDAPRPPDPEKEGKDRGRGERRAVSPEEVERRQEEAKHKQTAQEIQNSPLGELLGDRLNTRTGMPWQHGSVGGWKGYKEWAGKLGNDKLQKIAEALPPADEQASYSIENELSHPQSFAASNKKFARDYPASQLALAHLQAALEGAKGTEDMAQIAAKLKAALEAPAEATTAAPHAPSAPPDRKTQAEKARAMLEARRAKAKPVEDVSTSRMGASAKPAGPHAAVPSELAGQGTPLEKIQRLHKASIDPRLTHENVGAFVEEAAAGLSGAELKELAKGLFVKPDMPRAAILDAITNKIAAGYANYRRGLEGTDPAALREIDARAEAMGANPFGSRRARGEGAQSQFQQQQAARQAAKEKPAAQKPKKEAAPLSRAAAVAVSTASRLLSQSLDPNLTRDKVEAQLRPLETSLSRDDMQALARELNVKGGNSKAVIDALVKRILAQRHEYERGLE